MSGVDQSTHAHPDWFSNIPTDWERKKIKRLSAVKRGASPRPIDDPKYFDDEGTHGWVRIADVTASNKFLKKTEQRLSALGRSLSVAVPPGDLVVTIAGTVGKPIIVDIPCCIHDGFVYFVGLKESPEFLYYVFLSGRPYQGLGKLGTQLNLNTDTIGDIVVPIPKRELQDRIVAFLDRETAEADALVAKYERLIELLEEKRVALITQAVTKGLDSTAAMKDSGYAWIPSIPSHWSVLPLKHLTSIPITDGPHETPEFIPDGIPFVSAEAVSSGRIDFTKIRGYISVRDHQIYSRKYSPLRGDIFIIKSGATTGISAIVETDEMFDIWSPLAAVRCGPQALASYILQVIRSKVFRDSIALHWNYGTQQNIGMSVLENLPVPLPPLPEQEQLVAFIENNIAKIEMTQASARAAIGLTKEHRSALITAAVTGQIDVDTYRSKKPAEVPA